MTSGAIVFKIIRLVTVMVFGGAALQCQILEDFACISPASVSSARPAVVTCPSQHGYNQRAYFRWTFDGPSASGSTITVDSNTYTMVTSIDNSIANQVLLGDTPHTSTINLTHAVNDDGIGKGTLYSSATAAHPTVQAFTTDDTIYKYVDFWYLTVGPAGLSAAGTSASGANGSFDSPQMRLQWTVNISGGTGSWSGIGSNQTPRIWLARYVSPVSFALYTTGGSPSDTTANGEYSGQSLTVSYASGDGTNYPFAYTGESWSLSSTNTPEGFFQVNIPGCPNPAHETECSMAFRVPEVAKYPGLSQKISSFSIAGGVATVTLTAAFPYSKGETRTLKNASLMWIRNIADPPGTWTHTSTYQNAGAATTKNHVVKFAASAGQVQGMENGDRGGAIGICQDGCGNSGTAAIADGGLLTCTFDSATTAGDWVAVSTYDDRCHDAGAGYAWSPQGIGVVLESGPAGNHPVWWNGLNRAFTIQSVTGAGDGSGVTQVTVNVPGYPDGTYSQLTLPSYAGGSTPSYSFVSATYPISPIVYFLGREGGGYIYPFSTIQAIAKNQATYVSGQTNRIEFAIRWGVNHAVCGFDTSSQIGTYIMPPGFTTLGGHFYHNVDTSGYANQWARYVWTQTPSHAEGVRDTSYNYPNDPGLSGNSLAWNGKRSYFDSLSSFYLDFFGLTCPGTVTGQPILLSPLTYSSATDEPDELVLTRGGTWSPARFQAIDAVNTPTGTNGYDLFWGGPKAYVVQYEVRYSTTGSLKTRGFSTGLCKNGSGTCDASDHVSTNGSTSQVYYQSAPMPEASRVWWGIKPISTPVIGVSGAGQRPTWVITPVSLGLTAAGDRVTVANVKGNTAANQTNVPTAAIQPYQFWSRFDVTQHTQGGLTYSNNGGVIQVQLAAHGYSTGDLVQLAAATPTIVNSEWTITVIDANNFTLNSSGYNACPCSGGWTRREINSALRGIDSDGAGSCTANLSVPHNLVPGWNVLVTASASNQLTPGGSPTPYTVTSTPSGNSFGFACPGVSAGTYSLGPDTGQVLNVAAYPGIALDVTGNGSYTGAGAIYSNEDNKGFAELELGPNAALPTQRRLPPVRPALRTSAVPAICTYGLLAGTAALAAASGSGTLSLATNEGCPWTASSDSRWLTINPTGGSGPAAIAFLLAANGGGRRTGTITIGGQTFIVRQAAKPPEPDKTGVFRSGAWLVDRSGDGLVYDTRAGSAGVPIVGDWNGDGRTKTGVFRNGLWSLNFDSEGKEARTFPYTSSPGDIPVVGDWNGDGRTKTGIFRNGLWILDFDGDGREPRVFQYTWDAGDIPVVGDWNGDGSTKTGIFRNGLWVLDYDGTGKQPRLFQYTSSAGDIPIVGDWNGDGRTKTGIFRNGLWILDYDGERKEPKAFQYTRDAGDIPVVGDWNGDGRTKTGIFRHGLWVLDFDGDGKVDMANPGPDRLYRYAAQPGDIPLIGKWAGTVR